jgi:hypothetical protein
VNRDGQELPLLELSGLNQGQAANGLPSFFTL